MQLQLLGIQRQLPGVRDRVMASSAYLEFRAVYVRDLLRSFIQREQLRLTVWSFRKWWVRR